MADLANVGGSGGGLVESLAGLQRFMFREVIVHTNNMILIVNKWKNSL